MRHVLTVQNIELLYSHYDELYLYKYYIIILNHILSFSFFYINIAHLFYRAQSSLTLYVARCTIILMKIYYMTHLFDLNAFLVHIIGMFFSNIHLFRFIISFYNEYTARSIYYMMYQVFIILLRPCSERVGSILRRSYLYKWTKKLCAVWKKNNIYILSRNNIILLC